MTLRSPRWTRSLLLALALVTLAGAPASANPVPFAPNLVIGPNVYGQGSDPSDPVFQSIDYVLETAGTFYPADETGNLPVSLTISKCIVASGSSSCVNPASIPNGDPYSVIAQITLDSVANPLPQDGMLLLLSGVAPTPAYAYDAVSVYYSDPGDVPSMPISPLIRAERLTSQGVTNRYLGLYFADLNTPTLTVRLEIDAMVGQTAPSIMLTAAYLSTPIPEPSTALMVGLGLIGLAVQRRR